MPVVYVETSALGRVLLDEPDANAIVRSLDDFDRHVASRLLRVELRRVALRKRRTAEAEELLASVALVPLDDAVLTTAETVPPSSVATLDAIHLATAIRLARADALDAVMTYDARLAAGAREHGLTVLAPT